MPLVFRSMLADGSGLMPRVGNDAKSLGVRVEGETNGQPDIAVQDGIVNHIMELKGDLATGLYMVNIIAGDKTYTERLVIQP